VAEPWTGSCLDDVIGHVYTTHDQEEEEEEEWEVELFPPRSGALGIAY